MKKIVLLLIGSVFFASTVFVSAQETENLAGSEVIADESAEESADSSAGENKEPVETAETSETDNTASDDIAFDTSSLSGESSGFLHENDGKKHWFSAISFVAFFNVGLCTWNRYMIGSSWAKVGWDEWDHFWERKLSWDDDWYWTNFVLHPYQGSLYYMASRGSNLNMLESFAITVVGSAAWEYLCETNAPSKNDMTYTTIGAVALGEMLYRLSLNADEVSSLLGFAINPTRLWTQGWTRQKPRGTTHNIHELYTKVGIGSTQTHTNLIHYNGDYKQNELYPVFVSPEIYVAYNDPYGHDSNDPFGEFELKGSFAVGAGSGYGADCAYKKIDKKMMYDIRIESNSMLWARAPKLSESTDTTVGLSFIYDFDWHSFYQLCCLTPALAIKQRVNGESSRFEWQAHLGWDLLGTTDFYYFHRDLIKSDSSTNRTYSYTMGPQALLRARWISDSGFALNFGVRGYAMYDFYNQLKDHASTGYEYIGIANASVEVPVSKKLRLGIGDEIYLKRAYYKDLPDVFQAVNTGSLFAKWQLR